jgi:hypothetical protein
MPFGREAALEEGVGVNRQGPIRLSLDKSLFSSQLQYEYQ